MKSISGCRAQEINCGWRWASGWKMFHEGNQCRQLPSPFPQVRHIPLKIQLVGLCLNVRSVCTSWVFFSFKWLMTWLKTSLHNIHFRFKLCPFAIINEKFSTCFAARVSSHEDHILINNRARRAKWLFIRFRACRATRTIPAPLAELHDQLFKQIIERNSLATHCVQA